MTEVASRLRRWRAVPGVVLCAFLVLVLSRADGPPGGRTAKPASGGRPVPFVGERDAPAPRHGPDRLGATGEEILAAVLNTDDPATDCTPFITGVTIRAYGAQQVQIKTGYGATRFPTNGPDFLCLASGDPDAPGEYADVDFGQAGCREDTVQITFHFDIPEVGGEAAVKSITFDFDMLSYEVFEFIGSTYNDYVFGYLDTDIPIALGSYCAPYTTPATGCLITRDRYGHPTNLNSGFFDLCSNIGCDAPGTLTGWETWCDSECPNGGPPDPCRLDQDSVCSPGEDAGRTGTLQSCTPLACHGTPTAGVHTITWIVGDVDDGVFTTAGLFDNLRCYGTLECDGPVVQRPPPEITCLQPLLATDPGSCDRDLACEGEIASCADGNGAPGHLACEPPGPYGPGVHDVRAACTDGTGASDTATCQVAIYDEEPPALREPPSLTLACDEPTDPSGAGEAVASDNCAVESLGFVDETAHGPCPDDRTITRRWTALDSSGNQAVGEQRIAVRDTTAPLLQGVPPDLTVDCSAIPDPAQPAVLDDCDPAPALVFRQTIRQGSGDDEIILTREWTATDRCDNAATERQSITLVNCVTAVRYAFYEAHRTSSGRVEVVWGTVAETDTVGFLVLRHASAEAPGEAVSRGIVFARGAGSRYAIIDTAGTRTEPAGSLYQIVEMKARGPGEATPLFPISQTGAPVGIGRSRSRP